MGKPLDSPASFRPIFLIYWVSKLFERIILSCLLFFLKSNSILSPRQAGVRSKRSILDQSLFLSQFISDESNKARLGFLTILSTIDFSKVFDSVWLPALFYKFRFAFLLALLVGNLSFVIGALAWFFKIKKSRFFRVRRGVLQGSVLSPVLFFFLFVNDLSASLPSSVSCSLYADDLAILSFSFSLPATVEATQGALI